MTTVATLTTVLDANTRGLQTGLQDANRNVTGFTRSAMNQLGSLAAFVGGGALATSAVQMAITWEAAFADVEKTVDASGEQLESLSDTLREMATSGTLGALENAHQTLAQIAASAGALGVETSAIDEFTQAVASLAVASDLTADAGATFIARFANIAGLDLAADADNLADTLVTLGNNMAATESDIASFANRLASLSTFDYSPDEILGLAAAMASLGISAELGGTNLLKTVSDITSAVALGGTKLESFATAAGMTADQFKALAENDPSAALMAFVEGLAGMDASGQLATLNELNITGMEQQRVLMTMAAGLTTVNEGLAIANVAWQGNGAAMTEAAAKAATVSGSLNKLSNNVTDLGIELMTRALPGINGMVEGLTALIKGNFGDGVAQIATGFSNIVDAFAGTDLTAGVQAFFDAMGMIDEIMLAGAKTDGKDFNFFGAIFEQITPSIAAARDAIQGELLVFWADLGAQMSAGATGLREGVEGAFAIIWDNVARAFRRGILEVQYQFVEGLAVLRDTVLQNTGFDIAPEINLNLENLAIERGELDTADFITQALRDDMADGELSLDHVISGLISLDPAALAETMGLDARQAVEEALRMAISEGDQGAIEVLTPLANELEIDTDDLIRQMQAAIDEAAANGAFTAQATVGLDVTTTINSVSGGGGGGGGGGNTTINSYGTNPRDLSEQVDRAGRDRGR